MPFLFQLQFTGFSLLWMLFSVALGLLYAFILYRRNKELSLRVRRLLFALRTLAVAVITFLLFAPFIKLTDKTVEKPLILILQDNSASISVSHPANFNPAIYNQQIRELGASFSEEYEVQTLTFGTAVRQGMNVNYTENASDINAAFQLINDRYANRNIGAVILASDGIYNRGGSPQYEALKLKAPVYTIALGDTVPKKDLLIANVNYNKIAYLGNDFQIQVEVEAFQSKGVSSRLTVSGKSGPLFSRNISINSNEYRTTIPVTLPAKQKGIQRFTVSIAPVAAELSKANNNQIFFVEVLDGRKNVFILANSPHPDIAALKQSIEINKNYEVKTGFSSLVRQEDVQKADLVILHQIPSVAFSADNLKALLEKKNRWFVLGSQSDIRSFSGRQNLLNIVGGGSMQESIAKVDPGFYDFVLSDATKGRIQTFDPLLTPFGNYAVKGQASVLLSQQIGKVATNRALLIFGKEGQQRTAVLTGEGIWRWRLQDFKESGNHQTVDELVGKVVQYLSSQDDKRRFRVYPAKNAFDESEHVIINAELYNETLELINTPEVAITLTSARRTYPFQFSRTGASYILDAGILPPGEYSFSASTQLGKTKHIAKGQFVVSQQQTELRQTTADHQLLNTIARQSSAEMVFPAQIPSLVEKVKKNEMVKSVSYEDRTFEEMINSKLLFFVILGLISLEWLGRKRNGEL